MRGRRRRHLLPGLEVEGAKLPPWIEDAGAEGPCSTRRGAPRRRSSAGAPDELRERVEGAEWDPDRGGVVIELEGRRSSASATASEAEDEVGGGGRGARRARPAAAPPMWTSASPSAPSAAAESGTAAGACNAVLHACARSCERAPSGPQDSVVRRENPDSQALYRTLDPVSPSTFSRGSPR